MVDKVYTRKGDDGTTQLLFAGQERVAKSSLRVNAYGDADEGVAVMGVARAYAAADAQDDVAELLLRLEREMFIVNAELATDPSQADRGTAGMSLVTSEMVDALETEIDGLTGQFEQPKDFIVPGNTILGSHLDLATRVVRRCERSVDALARAEAVRDEVRRYLNRLADLLWVLARYAEREHRQPRPRSD